MLLLLSFAGRGWYSDHAESRQAVCRCSQRWFEGQELGRTVVMDPLVCSVDCVASLPLHCAVTLFFLLSACFRAASSHFVFVFDVSSCLASPASRDWTMEYDASKRVEGSCWMRRDGRHGLGKRGKDDRKKGGEYNTLASASEWTQWESGLGMTSRQGWEGGKYKVEDEETREETTSAERVQSREGSGSCPGR